MSNESRCFYMNIVLEVVVLGVVLVNNGSGDSR